MEIWKDINGYKGFYQISNFGRVKSLKFGRERILKHNLSGGGYHKVNLSNSGKVKKIQVHLLVWDHFSNIPRNGMIIQVDHHDEDKNNNRFDNLRLLNNRDNCSKGKLKYKKSSKYTGVSWCKNKNYSKWVAMIRINKKQIHLGYFDIEEEAHLAYQKALSNLHQTL